MSRQQTAGHFDWIWVPFVRRCWVGEDRVELTPPLIFGRSYLFDGTRQVVTIRRCLLGRTLSEEEISFSDVTIRPRKRHNRETSPDGSSRELTPIQFIDITVVHGKANTFGGFRGVRGEERPRRILEAIEKLGIQRTYDVNETKVHEVESYHGEC